MYEIARRYQLQNAQQGPKEAAVKSAGEEVQKKIDAMNAMSVAPNDDGNDGKAAVSISRQ